MNKMLILTSNSLPIFIAISFICMLHIPNAIAEERQLLKRCSSDTNYTSGSTFRKNIILLLNYLTVNGATHTYFNRSVGAYPDTVYGHAQCRDDLSLEACRSCLQTAEANITKMCPAGKSATVRYDHCILRYSGENFFSVKSDTSKGSFTNSIRSISDAQAPQFSHQREVLLNTLSNIAVSNETRYSSGDTAYAESKTIYGVVQCTRDLSSTDCLKCLQDMISMIPGCCDRSETARMSSISCYLRYNITSFVTIPPPRTDGKKSTNIALIILPVIGSVVVLSVCAYFLARRIWKRPKKAVPEVISDHASIRSETALDIDHSGTRSEASLQSGTRSDSSWHSDLNHAGIKSDVSPQFDLNAIRVATNEFSETNRLGEGGFGTVYKGKLLDGQEIAVKRLSINSEQGLHEFKNEVDFLLELQHRNLVRLLGYCVDKNETLLIYEFVSNTSLDKYIFDSRKKSSLDWKMREKIIGGIARGLLYLHEDSRLTIIHRDLKAGNILLDEKMNAKIADFGLAKLFSLDQIQDATYHIVGTPGYIAPEYAIDGIFSVKSDVFSFGILLLEIVSGRKASSFSHASSPSDLQAHAWNLWDKRDNKKLMDSAIRHSYSTDVKRYIHIGLLCVQHNVEDRPTMSSVIKMFNNNNITLERPTLPTSLMKSRYAAADTESDDQSLL